ncbi:MAG: exosome complex exonuclease Rrp41 [Methanosarcinaceae archaeon]|nr:exosome complex exonuclease Rrp41 [Methanosarcinaceae archaeon]
MSSSQQKVEFFDENGLRTDGRRPDEIRPMKIKIGVLSRADGSCYLEWGANKILAAVYGPREAHPRRTQLPDRAVVRYRYNMQSFSVEERARPGPSRRSSEISKVSREAFEPVIFTEAYPKAAIDIYVEVLQADAGTRTAAINAASLALVDAGIPMRSIISACAVGKVDGQLVLDLNKPEDNYGDADLPIAMTEDGGITLMQMDGDLSPEEFTKALDMVTEGCRQVLAIQKQALAEKFGSFGKPEYATLRAEKISQDEPEDDIDDDAAADDETREDVAGDIEIREDMAADVEIREDMSADDEIRDGMAGDDEIREDAAGDDEIRENMAADDADGVIDDDVEFTVISEGSGSDDEDGYDFDADSEVA